MQGNQSLGLSLVLLSSLMVSNTALAEDSSLPQDAKVAHGKTIFSSICAHCHHTNYDESRVGAPGLQGVLDRHDETWISQWLKSPETFAKKDSAAHALIRNNKFGLIMPTFPAMQDDKNRAAVIEFLKTLK